MSTIDVSCRGNIVRHWCKSQITGEAARYQSHYKTGLSAAKECLRDQFIRDVFKWGVVKTYSRFSRRITCIRWHPNYHDVVAFASYAGDIQLCYMSDPTRDIWVEGEGYGNGCITQMYFNQQQPLFLYATSLNGTFGMKDLEGRHSEVYLNTMDKMYWWTSLAISNDVEVMFVGGNHGKAVVLDLTGNIIQEYPRFHKGKIHDAEFCPSCPWLLATASNDKCVSLWDIRMMGYSSKGKPSPLTVLKHTGPVSSVSFDPIYGSSLLTTAHNNEIRVYHSHSWEQPAMLMKHPHRHFQHLTNIRASWHPFYEDLCLVGRYPDSGDADQTRCVDLVDTRKGEVVGKLYDPVAHQITTLSRFNQQGNILATGMGFTAVLWEQVQRTAGSHGDVAKNRLLHPGRNKENRPRKPGKRKRLDQDDTSKAKLKCTSLTDTLRKKS